MKSLTRKQLLEDYREVNEQILSIVNSKENYFVASMHYLNPTIHSKPAPINDKNGEFEYFKQIRECLEGILVNWKAPFKIPHAPKYIARFF